MRRTVLILCLLTFGTTPGFSQAAGGHAYLHLATGLAFPPTLGILEFKDLTDYQQSHNRPDLGICVRYVIPGTPVRADIFLYDLNMKNLGTGISSPNVRKAFDMAIQDIRTLEKEGTYQSVQKIGEGETTFSTPGGSLTVLWAHFTFDRLPAPNVTYAGPLISHLYVTAYKNSILKVRFTSPNNLAALHQKALEQLLAHLGKMLT